MWLNFLTSVHAMSFIGTDELETQSYLFKNGDTFLPGDLMASIEEQGSQKIKVKLNQVLPGQG